MRARDLARLLETVSPVPGYYSGPITGYRAWCEKTGRPNLLVLGGTKETRSGRLRIRFRNGFIYQTRKTKPIGHYLPVYSYGGEEIAVRWDQRHNVHRFEALRWKLLNFMRDRVHRVVEAHSWKMVRHRQPITGHDSSGTPVSLVIRRRRSLYSGEMGFEVEEEHPEADKDDLLMQMAIESMGDKTEQWLLDRYYMLRAWEMGHERTLARLNFAIGALLTRLRGKSRFQSSRSCRAQVNGREYVLSSMSLHSRANDDISLWPDPRNIGIAVNLDSFDGKELLKKRCSEWE